MILKALTLLCECLNLAWPIYVQTGESGFNPLSTYTCLSLRLSAHIRPTHKHAKHQEERTCHCLSASCMCFQPGLPKIKQIIITDSNHWNQEGMKENAQFLSQSLCFFPLSLCSIPKSHFLPIGSQ